MSDIRTLKRLAVELGAEFVPAVHLIDGRPVLDVPCVQLSDGRQLVAEVDGIDGWLSPWRPDQFSMTYGQALRWARNYSPTHRKGVTRK